jgi:hypothetical protein
MIFSINEDDFLCSRAISFHGCYLLIVLNISAWWGFILTIVFTEL